MSENPYQSPSADADPEIVGVRSGRREDLRSIAVWQQGLLVCILLQIVAILVQEFFPAGSWHRLIVVSFLAATSLAGCVLLFGLSIKTELHPVIAVILGVFALFPCLGLLVLLAVNGRATKTLQESGYRVGLLGANLSQFR